MTSGQAQDNSPTDTQPPADLRGLPPPVEECLVPRKVQHSGRGRAFANFGLGCIAGAFLHGLAALGVIVATLGGTPLSLVVVGVDVAALVLLLVGGQRAAALGYVAALALVVAVPLVGIGLRLLSVVIP